MRLTDRQSERLEAALLEAFTTEESLLDLARESRNKTPEQIHDAANVEAWIKRVVAIAHAESWEDDLANAACRLRRRDVRLNELCDEIQPAPIPPPPRTVPFRDFEFEDRTQLCADMLRSNANHIELCGLPGAGKTYILRHIGLTHDEVRRVYIDLADHPTIEEIVSEAVRQLRGRPIGGRASLVDLAMAIYHHYRPGGDRPSATHVLFLFDSATEEHRETLDWLVSRDGLINNDRFRRRLRAQGIREHDIKLQVVIAVQQPIIQRVYHDNFKFDHVRITPLRPEKHDPIHLMLRQLAQHSGVPLGRVASRAISDKIYYLTGGHPKCAKALIFAIADDDFLIPTDGEWRDYLVDRIVPIIREEMLTQVDASLHQHFETLCIFRRFDQRLLGAVLKRRQFPNASDLEVAQAARHLRVQLQKTYIINDPLPETGFYYTMNSVVRRVLSLNLQYHDPARFRELNDIALEIYLNRLRETGASVERIAYSMLEILYHRLKDLETDEPAAPERICEELQAALTQHLPLLLAAVDDDKRAMLLQGFRSLWRSDRDLEETLYHATGGDGCWNMLSDQVRRFVDLHTELDVEAEA